MSKSTSTLDGSPAPRTMNAIPDPIPATTKERYIGGMAALNLPSAKGTGDWHMGQTFFRANKRRSRSFISGTGCTTDTNPFLGDAEIFDCTSLLNEIGVSFDGDTAYAASHFRAIADLVISSALRNENLDFIELDVWMPKRRDKESVANILTNTLIKLPGAPQAKVHEWLKKAML